MRSRKVLLVLVPTAAAAFLAVATALGAPPGATYPWAQPGTATPVGQCTQPPASVPIVPVTPAATTRGCDYAWAQPGTTPPTASWTQPPASVPIVVPAKTGP